MSFIGKMVANLQTQTWCTGPQGKDVRARLKFIDGLEFVDDEDKGPSEVVTAGEHGVAPRNVSRLPPRGPRRANTTGPLELNFVVPEGKAPGDEVMLAGPHGLLRVLVPPGTKPGDPAVARIGPSSGFKATVPEGAQPGNMVLFELPSGDRIQAPVPVGKKPGDTFEMSPPVIMVQVPEGAAPGDEVVFVGADGKDKTVHIPPGKMPLEYFDVPIDVSGLLPKAEEKAKLTPTPELAEEENKSKDEQAKPTPTPDLAEEQDKSKDEQAPEAHAGTPLL